MAAAMVEVGRVQVEGKTVWGVLGTVEVWVRLDRWRGQVTGGMVWVVLGVEETWVGEEGEERNVDVVRSDVGLQENVDYAPHISVARMPLTAEELEIAREKNK